MKNKSKRIASILLIMSILAFPCLQTYAESVVSIYDLGNDVVRGKCSFGGTGRCVISL